MQEVSLHQAMESLQAMFSTVDRSIIQMVLKKNNGHLEMTIDELLRMQEEQQSAKWQLKHYPPSTIDGLPEDFLVYEDPTKKQISQDEALAWALQDEAFLEHLSQHPEFAASLGADQPRQHHPQHPQHHPEKVYVDREPEPSILSTFKQQLGHMSEATKQMFFDIRSRFASNHSEIVPDNRGRYAAVPTTEFDESDSAVRHREKSHSDHRNRTQSNSSNNEIEMKERQAWDGKKHE
eukprot:c126_g1_i1.p1 GENE.c126_g1_i1~~c126_g1_i1.p1  ORF type:complete len:245 (-),score=46.56 c126_g1_i1:62-769(-)